MATNYLLPSDIQTTENADLIAKAFLGDYSTGTDPFDFALFWPQVKNGVPFVPRTLKVANNTRPPALINRLPIQVTIEGQTYIVYYGDIAFIPISPSAQFATFKTYNFAGAIPNTGYPNYLLGPQPQSAIGVTITTTQYPLHYYNRRTYLRGNTIDLRYASRTTAFKTGPRLGGANNTPLWHVDSAGNNINTAHFSFRQLQAPIFTTSGTTANFGVDTVWIYPNDVVLDAQPADFPDLGTLPTTCTARIVGIRARAPVLLQPGNNSNNITSDNYSEKKLYARNPTTAFMVPIFDYYQTNIYTFQQLMKPSLLRLSFFKMGFRVPLGFAIYQDNSIGTLGIAAPITIEWTLQIQFI